MVEESSSEGNIPLREDFSNWAVRADAACKVQCFGLINSAFFWNWYGYIMLYQGINISTILNELLCPQKLIWAAHSWKHVMESTSNITKFMIFSNLLLSIYLFWSFKLAANGWNTHNQVPHISSTLIVMPGRSTMLHLAIIEFPSGAQCFSLPHRIQEKGIRQKIYHKKSDKVDHWWISRYIIFPQHFDMPGEECQLKLCSCLLHLRNSWNEQL